jgi:hypothetical protein
VDDSGETPRTVTVLGPGELTGDVAHLTGRASGETGADAAADTPDLMTLADRITESELAAAADEDPAALLDELADLSPEERQAL